MSTIRWHGCEAFQDVSNEDEWETGVEEKAIKPNSANGILPLAIIRIYGNGMKNMYLSYFAPPSTNAMQIVGIWWRLKTEEIFTVARFFSWTGIK